MQSVVHKKNGKRKSFIQKKITKGAAVELVKNLVSDIRRSGVKIERAFLFGSYAKNIQREWSDIDVALVADNFMGVSFIDAEAFKKVLLKTEYIPIQLKTYSSTEFNNDDFVKEEIKPLGIEISIK